MEIILNIKSQLFGEFMLYWFKTLDTKKLSHKQEKFFRNGNDYTIKNKKKNKTKKILDIY